MTLTSQSIKYYPKKGHKALASFLGCLYVMVLLFSKLRIFTIFPFKISIVVLMVFITFGKKDILFIFKSSAIFIFYSMMLAGLCFYLHISSPGTLHITAVIKYIPYNKLLMAPIIMYLVLYRILVYVRDRKQMINLIYDVNIHYGKSSTIVKALLDTGNELREPVTNLPVLIVENHIFSTWDINSVDKLYIPYRSVNGESGKIIGIKPLYIEIQIGKEKERREVIIGLCNNKLSNCDEYEALLSRGII